MSDERRRAARRVRRILLNNEGGDRGAPEAATPEGFLSVRMTPLVGSKVDTVLYCSHGSFGRCSHKTAVGEVSVLDPNRIDHVLTLMSQGRDCLQIIADFCREHGMEAFWSMRMNDVHDGKLPELASQFKKDHPEWLLGVRGDHRDDFVGEARWWCGVDYARGEVREMAFRLLEEVCRNYDLDGVELDFFRHPIYFKPNRRGLPAQPRHLAMMTDFMRRVHAMTVQVGAERGRPVLVTVRVPDAIRVCAHTGLDIETWARDGLVDMIVPGGYYHVAPWEEMIDLGHEHDIPVFPCISASRLRTRIAQELDGEYLLWRGEALNVWGAGADGVYVFNYFDYEKGDGSFFKMAEPDQLRRLHRVYAPNNGAPEKWLGRELTQSLGLLPLSMAAGESREAGLHVYEEMPGGSEVELSLRVRLSRFADEDGVRVTCNGAALSGLGLSPLSGGTLSYCDVTRMPGCWVECAVDPSVLRRGENRIAVRCLGGAGGGPLQLQDVQLEVRPR